MTKNDSTAKQTIRVFSAEGNEIGTTYPKRAAGLVKKGRAHFVNDCDIRLNVSDVTTFTEENTMMDNNINTNDSANTEPVNKLYFDAREWILNKECKNNVGNRSFMQGPDGVINEAFMIGNWGWDWTEIISKIMLLPKNTLNTFTFWLNGGENDNSNEVCRFEVIFNNDYENRYTYNLNRNFIKPLKKCNGWELYEIPFRTGDNEYTQFKFIAQRAYMTVLNAKDVSEYADLPDTVDPYEQYRPQRHNIIFADGWPTNTNYSTVRLEQMYGQKQQGDNAAAPTAQQTGFVPPKGFPFEVPQGFPFSYASTNGATSDSISQSIVGSLESLRSFDFDALRESLQSSLAGNPNLSANEVQEIIEDSMESAQDAISDAIDDLNDALEELHEALGEMQD